MCSQISSQLSLCLRSALLSQSFLGFLRRTVIIIRLYFDQMAERLETRVINQKVVGLIPGSEK